MTKTKTKTRAKSKIKIAIDMHNKKVRRENKRFEGMTPAQKRVRIAQDVIALAEDKVLVPKSSIWVARVGAKADKDAFGNNRQPTLVRGTKALSDTAQVRELLPDLEACNACAVGAIFYCTVMRANDLTVEDLRHSDDEEEVLAVHNFDQMTPYLKKYFSEDQLRLMELAFERGDGGTSSDGWFLEEVATRMFKKLRTKEDVRNDQSGDSALWKDDGSTDSERLVAIMQNVVRNEGLFLPELRYGA